ncbi:MAG: hypothetical protein V7756_16180, partial [Halopseudomonas sp.]|uniref:hypothetical protein n=1 Tax=Halopseudomonas sp. TaxID=2901191 RepID=UPI0030021D24
TTDNLLLLSKTGSLAMREETIYGRPGKSTAKTAAAGRAQPTGEFTAIDTIEKKRPAGRLFHFRSLTH